MMRCAKGRLSRIEPMCIDRDVELQWRRNNVEMGYVEEHSLNSYIVFATVTRCNKSICRCKVMQGVGCRTRSFQVPWQALKSQLPMAFADLDVAHPYNSGVFVTGQLWLRFEPSLYCEKTS